MTDDTGTPMPLSWQAAAQLRKKRLCGARAQPGTNRDLLEKTRILRDVIDPGVLCAEPEAANTRWAQYGYVSAFDATEDFTLCYVRTYNNWIKRYRSEPHACPVDPEFVLNDPGMMNALYRARQFADEMGISYPVFVAEMFARLTGAGLYRRPPLPNHLYPPLKPRKREGRKKYRTKSGLPVDHKALRHGRRAREAMAARSVLGHDWDDRFFARNYVGDPAQERALTALAEHEEATTTPTRRLRYALETGRISVDNARRVFPDQVVMNALRDASSIPDLGAPDSNLAPYRPHCLGLFQPVTPAAECAECPWRVKCEELAVRAEREQFKLTGYTNRKEREAMGARDRKRDQRARERAGNPAPPSSPMESNDLSHPLIEDES